MFFFKNGGERGSIDCPESIPFVKRQMYLYLHTPTRKNKKRKSFLPNEISKILPNQKTAKNFMIQLNTALYFYLCFFEKPINYNKRKENVKMSFEW